MLTSLKSWLVANCSARLILTSGPIEHAWFGIVNTTALSLLKITLHWLKEKIRLTHYGPLALIEAHAAELRALGAQRIDVFGSFARGEATAESDVDVCLEFAKDRKTYDNFFAIYELLQKLFGRPIDLVPDGSLSERKARIILPTVRY